MRLIAATRNAHKLRELEQILAGFELVALPPDIELPPEDGETFELNALEKARATHSACGNAALADDSGIVARALEGRPGVRSARFAGEGASDEENLDLLISELSVFEDRSVAYVCALAHIDAEGTETVVEARCEGTLILEPRGDRGFGYDPAFVPRATGPGDDRTMAELTDPEKHVISHRGRAARELARVLGSGGRP
ncbi:MAG: non-canonical purine NTP pyrophosphatase [Solirubrobacterales bacterium]